MKPDLSDPKLFADTPPPPEPGTVKFALWEREWLREMEELARTLPPEEVARFSRPRVRPRWLSRPLVVTFRTGRSRGPRSRRTRTVARSSRGSPSSSDSEGSDGVDSRRLAA